ncbi:MAG: ABC transporter permease [Nocardiopsaceae bacterium]|jgi:ABC-type dipeptide/oligopeptide/nickel transport system permease subunit|nr:ABC transporter permease [Nocardiopsaceae bacterium]
MAVQASHRPPAVTAGAGDAEGRSRLRLSLRSGKLLTGTAIFAVFVVVAIIGPMVVSTDPSALSADALRPPSAAHWLGTTRTGQDVFAQLIYGTRVSMLVGIVAGAIATVLSVIVGLIGGYVTGIVDEVLSVVSNVFLVIPALPLVIVLAGYLPNKGTLSVALVISITGWAWGARIIRAQTLSIRKRDYVEAARASGEGFFRILFWEILPHEGTIIAASFLGNVVFAILTQAGIAFLGLSDISAWSWGTMLYWAESNNALLLGAWWWFVPPGLAIGMVGTALALMNFGIDELVNPRLRAAAIGTKAAGRKLYRDSRREQHALQLEAASGTGDSAGQSWSRR